LNKHDRKRQLEDNCTVFDILSKLILDMMAENRIYWWHLTRASKRMFV